MPPPGNVTEPPLSKQPQIPHHQVPPPGSMTQPPLSEQPQIPHHQVPPPGSVTQPPLSEQPQIPHHQVPPPGSVTQPPLSKQPQVPLPPEIDSGPPVKKLRFDVDGKLWLALLLYFHLACSLSYKEIGDKLKHLLATSVSSCNTNAKNW